MTTSNEIERVSLNLEDRIAELQAELQLAYTRAQNAVEEAERERDERDATIAVLREVVRQWLEMFDNEGWHEDINLLPLCVESRSALAEQPSPSGAAE